MNKEEIEKAKEDLSFMNEGDYITREMANSKEILIKYIKSLEIINETYQVINELSEREIKELEQKTETLDKVTEECRKQMTTYEDSILEIFPQKILNIIEGEKQK